MNRDVNPGLEGIMLKLYLSPDNRYAAAFTNNSQVYYNYMIIIILIIISSRLQVPEVSKSEFI